MRYSYTPINPSTTASPGEIDRAKAPSPEQRGLLDEPSGRGAGIAEAEDAAHSPQRRQKWHRLSGWRVGATIAMCGAIATLCLNIGIAAYALSHRNAGSTDSSALIEVFHGDCRKASSLNTYAHLAINVISTLLLAGSNYCMQCLAAPTRGDVNAAHAKMKYLDIGVPSIRNLKHLSTGRRCLWGLLIVSSLPLHLMFNSVLFTSLATNDYNVLFVTPNFTTGGNFSTANGFNTGNFQPPSYKEDLEVVQQRIGRNEFDRLEKVDCIKAYAVDLLTDRRTLVVVSSNASTHGNGAVLGSGNQEYVKPERWYTLAEGYNPYTWLCGERDSAALDVRNAYDDGYGPYCNRYSQKLIDHPDVWAPSDWTPEYCLSEKVDGQCSCIVNMAIIWIIVACNIIKVIVMATVAFSNKLEQPLCTIGDAIASFVTDPDPTTTDMCMTTQEYIRMYEAAKRNAAEVNEVLFKENFGSLLNDWRPLSPLAWSTKRLRWWHAPSRARWWWFILFFTACLATTIGLLGRALYFYTGDKSLTALANIGLGHSSSQTMITGWAISSMRNRSAAIILSVLVANTPQIVLSFLYFSVNGICTCMSLSAEWASYSVSRSSAPRGFAKTLRTSDPVGSQRSTYFLQLPFRFAIPLIVVSTLLHWLISQSIFTAVITIYDELGNLKEKFAVTTCGFSPFAMILVIVAGFLLLLAVGGLGSMKLDPGMRVVGSCSAAISAACHVQTKSEKERWDLVQGPMVWGDIGALGNSDDFGFADAEQDDVRHCTFACASAPSGKQTAGAPKEGTRYR
jgi:hypothetical protein